MRHVTHMNVLRNASCSSTECVMSHILLINESGLTFWMSPVTHEGVSISHDAFICLTFHMCDMTHSVELQTYSWRISQTVHSEWVVIVRHDSFMTHSYSSMCDMTHSCVWHDSFWMYEQTYSLWILLSSYILNESCHTHEWVTSHMDAYDWVMNESCHTWICMNESWMSHVTRMKESWMSHVTRMNESWMSHVSHIKESWISHVTRMNESWMSHVKHEWVWMSHDWVMMESCLTYEGVVHEPTRPVLHYEWVMWHIWMSHVTHWNESCHTYEWVKSYIMNESCHTYEWVWTRMTEYEWVMSHIWMSHVTHMNNSSRTLRMSRCSCATATTHSYCVAWLIHMSAVTHLYVRYP